MIAPVKPVGFSLSQRCVIDDTCSDERVNREFLLYRETAGNILCPYTWCLYLFYQNDILLFFYLLLHFIRQIVSYMFSMFCFVFYLRFRMMADLHPSVLKPESAVRLDSFSFHNQFDCLPKPKDKNMRLLWMQGGWWMYSLFFFLTYRAYFPREFIHPNAGFTSRITLFSALYSSRQQVIEDGAV